MTISAFKTMKKILWKNAPKIKGRNANKWRYDVYGKPVQYDQVEVDHIIPQALGGSDDIKNLQLLNKTDNIRKSNKLDDSNRILFHRALQQKEKYFSKYYRFYRKQLKVGLQLLVKQTPVTKEVPATITAIHDKTVEVLLENRSKATTVVKDRRLFLEPPTSGTRSNSSSSSIMTRSRGT